MKMERLVACIFFTFVTTQAVEEGTWGTWGEWLQCSRSCGGGITSKTRDCIKDENDSPGTCDGESVTYHMCNIQDCPDGSVDFRSVQCSAYNDHPYKNDLYKWTPYHHKAGQCELKCKPENLSFYVRFAQKVVDGTRCNEYALDVCVNGSCLPVGCDMQLYSQAQKDNCGICNGDNSSCYKVERTFQSDTEIPDYVFVTTIPAGGTNVLIKEEGEAKNYIAITSNDRSILNGNYVLSPPDIFKLHAGYLIYKRGATNEVFINGPIETSLDIYVLNVNNDIQIYYTYYIPHNVREPAAKKIVYEWVTGDWSSCSLSCASGSRIREVFCVNRETNQREELIYCDESLKPVEQEGCNPQRCPSRWYISTWSPCSTSCGLGFQTRRVNCVETIKDGNINMLENSECSIEAPINIQECKVNGECPEWKVGEWSLCSTSCGQGLQTRNVLCTGASSANSVREAQCVLRNKPNTSQSCFSPPCSGEWVVGNWTECSSPCDVGMKTRSVYCRSANGQQLPDSHCLKQNEPVYTEECKVAGPCKPMWHASQWSECTAKCGDGMQMRNVICAEKSGKRTMLIVNNNACDEEMKPKMMQMCTNKKPCYTDYFVSEWSKCSATCGAGIQTRDVHCYGDRVLDYSEKLCQSIERPDSYQLCEMEPCFGNALANKVISTTTTPPTTVHITKGPAKITTFSGPESLHEKDNADFQCIVSGYPKPRVTWTLKNEPIKSSRFHVLDIAHGSRLVILAMVPSDSGSLRCTAENYLGRDEEYIQIEIMSAPKVSVDQEEITEDEGGNYVLRCHVTGTPLPRVQWIRDGDTYYGDNQRVIVYKDQIVFKSLAVTDTGKYRCIGFNSAGTDSASTNITVRKKIGFTKKDCFDNNREADCQVIATIAGLCNYGYYSNTCCKSCSKRLA